jgi:hypothetical protein
MGSSYDRTAIGFKVGTAALDTMYFMTETHEVKEPTVIHGLITSASLTYGVENNNVRQGTLLKSVDYLGVKYNFNYDAIIFNKDSASFNGSCLRNVTTDQCDSPLNIYFEYEGETGSPGTYQYTNRDSAYMYTDKWGYYTGKQSNYFGAVQPSMVNAGMLKQIKYYDSGTTTFEYESNNYYDPTVTSVVNGGGVRIKTITDYDGISITNNIVKNYSYLDPSTSNTSGIPISLPKVSFLRPVASSPTTTNSTVAATMDLSEDDHTIMYTHVKESQASKGYTQYEYKVPAGAFDTSVPLGDWTPTTAHAADSACVSMGLLDNQANTYPFAPNTNYDFERGLLKKQVSYNDGGNEVAESTYTYQRTNSPTVIEAFRYDKNDYAKSYSKYSIYADVSELTTVIKRKLYDLNSTTVFQLDSTKFVYGTAAKKQVIQQEETGSDGSVTRTNISYSKEYTGVTASAYTTALVAKNINIPLETYTEVKPAGAGSFKVTSGQVTKFDSFTSNDPLVPNTLPSSILKFVSVTGLNSFAPTLTTNAATPDSHYIVTNTLTNYDKVGFLKSAVGIDKRPQTILNSATSPYTDAPIAAFSNATPGEVAYNFNYITDAGFATSGFTANSIIGRSGMHTGIECTGSCTLSKAVTRKSYVSSYLFSIWIKASSSGSFNVVATGSGTSTVAISYSGGSVWKYYQIKIPVSSLSNTFTVNLTVGSGVNVDGDVILYPDIASVNTYGYNDGKYKIIETNTNGVYNRSTTDAFGRMLLMYDQDKNITARKSYKYDQFSLLMPDAVFYVDLPVGDQNTYKGVDYTFKPYNSFDECHLPGATFSWDYGDGSGSTSSNHHTYGTNGTYTVTLTITVPGVGTKYASDKIVIVSPPPPEVHLSYVNNVDSAQMRYVEFIQGGIVVYGFDADNVGLNTIPPGTYHVRIKCSNNTDTAMRVHLVIDTGEDDCKKWEHDNEYDFDITVDTILEIRLNYINCD